MTTRGTERAYAWAAFSLLVAITMVAIAQASAGDRAPRGETHVDLFGDAFRAPAWSPSAAERPRSHDADWLYTHGRSIRMDDPSCASCHAEAECTDCHAGLMAPLRVHPSGYLVIHGADATSNAQSCTSCHTVSRFCRSCHLEVRAAPDQDTRPAAYGSPHPAGWLDPGNPVGHAAEAQRDLMNCASCHSGQSCVGCHAYVNPHGPGFSRRCASMLDAGAPTCAQCHTSASTIPFEVLRAHPGCQR